VPANLTVFARTNIGNAKILGLQSDLGLSAYVSAVTSFPLHATQPTLLVPPRSEYANSLAIFFAFYIASEGERCRFSALLLPT
jgi:hypothetical protein